MARKRTPQKPVPVYISGPMDLPHPRCPMTERLITIPRDGRNVDIGWIFHRRYEHSFPADWEVTRGGGTTFGYYPTLEAATDGAQLYGRRYAALPAYSSFAQALGPYDEICSACGHPLPDDQRKG